MEPETFIEGQGAKGHLEYATPEVFGWRYGNTRHCSRLEVREMRAEFVIEEAFYRQGPGDNRRWREDEHRPRELIVEGLINRAQTVRRAADAHRQARRDIAQLRAEELTEAWERHRADLAYQRQGPTLEQELRIFEAHEGERRPLTAERHRGIRR